MAMTATTVRLTKLAQAGMLSAIRPILQKLWPYGKWFGIGALAAPTATHAINRLKGYNPEKELGIAPPENLMTTVTPRFARPYLNPASGKSIFKDNPTLESALRKLYGQQE